MTIAALFKRRAHNETYAKRIAEQTNLPKQTNKYVSWTQYPVDKSVLIGRIALADIARLLAVPKPGTKR